MFTMGRKKLNNKYDRLYSDIVKYQKQKGLSESIDLMLIDQLVFNTRLADDAMADIASSGIKVNVRKKADDDDPYWTTNPSVNVYFSALKMISMLCLKLGIGADARHKLGISIGGQKQKDPLGDLIG